MKKILAILASIMVGVSVNGANSGDIRSADYATQAAYGTTNFGVYAITPSSYWDETNIVVSGVATDTYINASGIGTYTRTSATSYSNSVFQNGNWFIQLTGSTYMGARWKLMNYTSPSTNYMGYTTNSPGVFLTNSVWTAYGADNGTCTATVSTVRHYVPVAFVGRSGVYTNSSGDTGVTNIQTFVNGLLVDP